MTAQSEQAADDGLLESIRLSPIATVVSNPRLPDNPVVAANAAFCALSGYGEEEIVGRNCRFLAGEATEPWQTERIREALRSLRPTLTELLNYRRDGSPFRNPVLVAPVFGPEGELCWFIGSQVEVGGAPDDPARVGGARRRLPLTAAARSAPEDSSGLPQQADRLAPRAQREDGEDAPLADAGELGVRTSADAVRLAVEAGL